MLELFHGPTLAFKDLAMQLLARLMDHVLKLRGERTTIVVATSGDTGGAAVEAFRGRAQVDLVVLFPQGRISEVQRRMMTTAPDDNVHAVAVEGTFDDCQALVKAMFNHHAFRDRVRLSGVNSINWARIVAQAVYYFTAAVALGAPQRKVAFTVPTGNFGDIYAGYVAAAHGPADRPAGDRHQRQRHPARAPSPPAPTTLREVIATASPSMDIQVSSNFERLLFEAYGRDAQAVRALMGSLAQSRRFALSARALGELRALFSAGRADEEESAATMRAWMREAGYCADPHTAVGIGGGREGNARPGGADGRAVDRASRQIPRRGRGGLRRASRRCRIGSPISARAPERVTVAAGRAGGGRAFRCLRLARGARRSRRMSVQVTRLASGLSVVTDDMPHLETASLGVWVGAGSRDEARRRARHFASARAHGLQGHQAAQRARDRRGRSRRSAAISMPPPASRSTAYYARVLKADVPLALDVLSDILADPAFDADELRREQNVIVQEIGAVEDAPDDLVFDRLQETAFPDQPVGRSILGTPRDGARRSTPARLRGYLARNYRAPDMVVAAAGAVEHAGDRRRGRAALCRLRRTGGAAAGAGALSRRHAGRAARSRAGAHRARARGPAASATRRSTACRSSPACSAAACPRACSRRCARSAASATRSTPSTCLMPTPACSGSMPAPTRATRPS